MAIDKGTSKPITQLSGLQINYKDKYSCFNPPIVTTSERDALVNTDDPKNPIKDGTTVFNSDSSYEEYYSSKAGKWIELKEGTGDVSGPEEAVDGNLVAFDGTSGKAIKDSGVSTDLVVSASSITVKKGQIPVWNNTAKGKINLANSGVTVNQIKQKNARKNVNATELYQLSNLGALQFGSNDNVADTGVILVDGLTPVTFQTQGTGVDSRVCSVINGEEGAGSSSPSALLEINSKVGGLLHARMTTAERDALIDPVEGLEIYNTDTKSLNLRQNNSWKNQNSKIKKSLVFNKDTLPSGHIEESIATLFPNTDSVKLTIISTGGNGGAGAGNYNGAGGGGGAVLIAYLNNLHSTLAKYIYIVPYYVQPTYQESWVRLQKLSGVSGGPQTYFQCVGYNMHGSDGNSTTNIGGSGAVAKVFPGSEYPEENFTWYGFNGSSGQGCSPNNIYSGNGGSSALSQGAFGIAYNGIGLDSIPGLGGGGSGGNGDGNVGGSGGGGWGTIIFEWEE